MYKTRQVFYLQIKCIKRSLFIPILLIAPFTLLWLRYNVTVDKIGGWLAVWASTTTYGYMIATLCCIILGMYIANDDYEVINTLNLEEKAIINGKVCCLLLFTLVILLEPIGIIAFHYIKYKNPTSNILINILINLIITWATGLSFASTLGFSIGYYIKSKLSYMASVIALFIISPYNKIFVTNNTLVNTIYSLLNIDINNINIPFDVITQNDFNLYWIYDKLFLVFLTIGIIALCIYKGNRFKKKNKSKGIVYLCMFGIVGTFLFIKAQLYYPKIYNISNINTTVISNDMVIEKYDMNIKLGEKFNNTCSIELNNTSEHEVKEIKLHLDKTFNIRSIKSDNDKLKYTRNANTINITFNKVAEPNQKMLIEISYDGAVNYVNNIGFDKYFTNANSTLLPSDSIMWYPRDNIDKVKYYTVNVLSNSKVYSNLQLSNNKVTSPNNYLFLGAEKEIFLISGYLSEKSIEKNKVIAPIDSIRNNNVDAVIKYIKEEMAPQVDPSLKFNKKLEDKNTIIYFVPLEEEEVPYKIYDDSIFINSYILSE